MSAPPPVPSVDGMTATPRAVRVVVVLLFANLAAGLLFAALTLIFRHDVLAYQAAADPHADPAALARTLWTRPIPVLAVGALYVWVARRLLAGQRSAFRRVRIVSAAGFLAVGWLLVSAAYPDWLRVVQAGQLALLAALVVAVNRRAVREVFAADTRVDTRPRNRRAAVLLVLMAPLIAEVGMGNISVTQAWVLPVFVPIYGGGALFLREVLRRTGGGIANLLLLGVVYGLVEEGLALQSLTSPHLYGAAGWAPRLFGLNTAYTELNLVYHALFSITIPIVVVELIFAGYGKQPYLRRGGVIAGGVVALLGGLLLRVAVPSSEDPGYQMPLVAILLIAAVAGALTVVALRRRVPSGRPAEPPRGAVLGIGAGLGTYLFLALLWHPAFAPGDWRLVAMAGAAVLAAAAVVGFRRWSADPRWTSRHVLAACVGALAGHTLFGLVANAETLADRLFLGALAVVTVALGVLGSRRLGERDKEPAWATAGALCPVPRAEVVAESGIGAADSALGYHC